MLSGFNLSNNLRFIKRHHKKCNDGNIYDGVIDFHQNLIEIWSPKSIFTSKKCHLDFMCLCIYTGKQNKLQYLYYCNINPKLLTCFNISLISIFDVIKTLILMLQIVDFFCFCFFAAFCYWSFKNSMGMLAHNSISLILFNWDLSFSLIT